MLVVWLIGGLASPTAWAGPQGERVRRGEARVSRKGELTRIKVSDGAVIDWDSFDVGEQEHVRFVQKSRRSKVLNRIDDGAPTQIDGEIRGRGQVYLANSAGIYFGGRAVVDVGRLVAVAGSLSERDFAEGRDRFRDLRGEVVNSGRIEGDSVALIGARVANHGQVIAREGGLLLAAGDGVWLARHGSHLLIKVAEAEMGDAERSAGSEPSSPAVENTGALVAAGGRARLAAGDLLSIALREDSSVRSREGIAVKTGGGGHALISGSLDASDHRPGREGGRIQIQAEVAELRGADLDASGSAGGGRIRVGGGVGGSGASRAQGVLVDGDSTLRADATLRGDGGRVVIWADDAAAVLGQVSARGGASGGDGGFVETSARRGLAVLQAADVGAEEGESGTWLIDPVNIEIVAVGCDAGDVQCLDDRLGPGLLTDPLVRFQPSALDEARVTNTAIVDALLRGGRVIVTTARFLESDSDDIGDSRGNILVSAPIEIQDDDVDFTTLSAQLILVAANDITLQNDPDAGTPSDDGIDEEGRIATSTRLPVDVFLLANDNALMPLVNPGFTDALGREVPVQGQPELPSKDNRNRERGDVLVESDVKIDTGGGALAIQGVNVTLEEDTDPSNDSTTICDGASDFCTRGGSFTLNALNPIGESRSVTGVDGTASVVKVIDTTGQEGFGNGLAVLQARGTLDVDARITSGDGGLALGGKAVEVASAASLTSSGSIDIGRDRLPTVRVNRDTLTLPATESIELLADVTSTGEDALLNVRNGDHVLGGALSASEGSVFAVGTNLSLAGPVTVTADEGATLGYEIALGVESGESLSMSADRLELFGGFRRQANDDEDPPPVIPDVSLDLQGNVDLFGDEIVLSAGDGASREPDGDNLQDDDPRYTAAIDLSGVQFANRADDGNPVSVAIAQDADLDDNQVPASGQWQAGGPAGVAIELQSRDGLIDLSAIAPAQVAGSELSLLSDGDNQVGGTRSALIPGVLPINPASVDLQVSEGFTLEAVHADFLRPTGGLAIHANVEGEADQHLDFESGVTVDLRAREISLRAGDGTGSDESSEVRLNPQVTLARDDLGMDVLPDRLEIRQDATLEDGDVPDATQIGDGTGLLGLEYALRSDDGSVTLSTPSKLDGTFLEVAARRDLQLLPTTPFQLLGADLGGVRNFTVTQPLLDGFTAHPTSAGDFDLRLRAALDGTGQLRFDLSGPITLQGDRIYLEAVADDPGTGGGQVEVPAGAPSFVLSSMQDSNAGPDLFGLRQDGALRSSSLPTVDQYVDDEFPAVVALRSEVGGVTLDETLLDPAGGLQGSLLVESPFVSWEAVTQRPGTGPVAVKNLDFKASAVETLIRGDQIVLEARQRDPDDDIGTVVNASENLWLAGFTVAEDAAPDISDRFDLPQAILGSDVATVFAGLGSSDRDTSPGSLTLAQESSVVVNDPMGVDGLLPDISRFAGGLRGDPSDDTDGMDYALQTSRGSIEFRDTGNPGFDPISEVLGARLRLTLAERPLNSSGAPAPSLATGERIIDFDGSDLEVESLRADVRGDFEVNAGTVRADDRIRLTSGGNNRREENLTFAPDVVLRADRIVLRAGRRDVRADDGGEPLSVVDAGASNLRLELQNDGSDDETRLIIEQDGGTALLDSNGNLIGTTLPSDSQIVALDENGNPTPGGIDAFQVTVDEGDIQISEIQDYSAQLIELEANPIRNRERSTIRLESAGDLDLSPLDLVLRSDRVVLEATGVVTAEAENLFIGDPLDTSIVPTEFTLIQGADITSDTTLPLSRQFLLPLSSIDYRLQSLNGAITVDENIAARLRDSQLTLIAQNDIAIAPVASADDRTALVATTFKARSTGTGSIVLNTDVGPGINRFRTTIATVGSQKYRSPVVLASDARLKTRLGLGKLDFQSTIDGGGALELAAAGLVRFRDDVGATTPLGRLDLVLEGDAATSPARVELGGDAASPGVLNLVSTGDVELRRSGEGVAREATLSRTGGNVRIESLAGDVRIGSQERVAVDGDLELRASAPGGVVHLADASARGRLAIDADLIELEARDSERLLRSDGAQVADGGGDIVANELDWRFDRLAVVGSGNRPAFGLPDPLAPPDFLVDARGRPRFPLAHARADRGPLRREDFVAVNGLTFDVRPEGASVTDLSDTLAPPATLMGRVVTEPPLPWDQEGLETVGVELRDVSDRELREWLAGAALYDDTTSPLGVVARPRLLYDAAQESADLHRRVFGEAGENAPAIREILQGALDAYLTEARPRRVVGFEFRRYVRNRPSSQFAAYQALEDLDVLFRRHRNSGLAPAEFKRIQAEWLRQIQPEGISVDELGETIHPSRYVRGSDILDIFGD